MNPSVVNGRNDRDGLRLWIQPLRLPISKFFTYKLCVLNYSAKEALKATGRLTKLKPSKK